MPMSRRGVGSGEGSEGEGFPGGVWAVRGNTLPPMGMAVWSSKGRVRVWVSPRPFNKVSADQNETARRSVAESVSVVAYPSS